jgi:hypothetical protein
MKIQEKLQKRVADGSMTQEWCDFVCHLEKNDCLHCVKHVPLCSSDDFKSKSKDEWVAYLKEHHKSDSELKKERLERYEVFKKQRRR